MSFPTPRLYKSATLAKVIDELAVACDGSTKSEIVIPLYMTDRNAPVGVLDLDSTVLSTFDEEDRIGLEGIVKLLSKACDWA